MLFPDSGFAKSDAVRYYKAVAKFLLPHLRNRPVSFKRFPASVHDEHFWEKDAQAFTPAWVKRFAVPRRTPGEDDIHYILINDIRTLTWVADAGGIELHPFLHVAPRIDIATQVVFDLDPGEGADIADCARVALLLRDTLAAIHLESFAKVSGSKGIQVYVPLNSSAPHAVTEPFARVVAEELARLHPRLITAQMTKALRRNRVFIDWSQNADYKTTVAVYSLRAKSERPYVSMPVRWEELATPHALAWEPDAALARIRKAGDLFAPLLTMKQKLPVASVGRASARQTIRRAEARPTRIPKPKSQSGRRLFVLAKTENGRELWLEMGGRFRRWILGRNQLATAAGELTIDRAFYRGDVPLSSNVTIEDSGAYELIEGSVAAQQLSLWFSGRVMSGAWSLEKNRLTPVR